MKTISRYIMTLVALLAVTTGAWAADVLNIVVDGTSATIKYDSNANNNPILDGTDWVQSGYDWDEEYTTRPTITTVTIDESCKNFSGTSLHGLLFWFSGLTTINGLDNLNTANVQDMENMFAGCSSLTSLDLSSWNTANVTTVFSMFDGCSKLTTVDLSGWNTEKVATTGGLFNYCSELTTVDLSSWNTAKVWNTYAMFNNCSKLENIYVGDGWSTAAVTQSDYMFKGCTKLLSMNTANPATDKTNAHTGDGGYLKVKPSTPSGPEVAWNKAEKTGTFTMPGGNVTLEPEYYPQAALTAAPTAINDVPATTDGAIVKAGTVANIGSTETAQGTVMYYISTTALDDAALLALAADKWTADVPTAEKLTKGEAYVYYYVRGNDSDTDEENFSDGDILAANALTVTIAAEPTYAVTFAEGTDPNEWTADPAAGVTKGQTVTVTYSGSKKVIGVKAEKKSAATYTLLSAATAEDIGKVVCAAGHLHDAKTAVPDGCTAVGILGKVTETGHGLILALQDATSQEWNTINGWASASYAGTTLKVLPDDAARGNLTSYTALGETTVSNWAVAQKSDYEPIFNNLGSTTDNNGKTCDGNVNAYITTGVGGTAITYGCWSATEYEDNEGWYFYSEYWSQEPKDESNHVRPVLGF